MSIINRTTVIHRLYISRTVSLPLSSPITDRFLSHRLIPKPVSPPPSSHHPIHKAFKFHRSSSYSSSPDYPTGDFDFVPHTGFKKILVKLKTLTALPSERIPSGSVLQIDLKGQISEQHGEVLSLPRICDNLLKAAYDPRISAVCLHIYRLNCGWAKLDEIRREIMNFRKSGKLIVAYVPEIGGKQYYIACACDEIYTSPKAAPVSLFKGGVNSVIPEVEALGSYKRLVGGEQIKDHSEMMTDLQDNIYSNWLDKVSSSTGKKREDIENFINGDDVYQVHKLKEEGFVSNLLCDDEVITSLIEKLGVKSLCMVNFRKYSRVREWTVGISRGEEVIAIIRVSGTIDRKIIAQEFINKIREVSESKNLKAVIVRIDSSGGDIEYSDSMWKKIRSLADKIPIIASMSDRAMGAGYYVAMGAGVIVAENLTLTGSIGVDSGNFRLENMYNLIEWEEFTGWGTKKYHAANTEAFYERARHMYIRFRDKAALSRSMTIDKMEEVAQGRIWTGKDAASHGLVDAIGGLSRAIAIAKLKANIPQNRHVTLVEHSIPSPNLLEVSTGIDYPLYDGRVLAVGPF